MDCARSGWNDICDSTKTVTRRRSYWNEGRASPQQGKVSLDGTSRQLFIKHCDFPLKRHATFASHLPSTAECSDSPFLVDPTPSALVCRVPRPSISRDFGHASSFPNLTSHARPAPLSSCWAAPPPADFVSHTARACCLQMISFAAIDTPYFPSGPRMIEELDLRFV